MIKIKKSATADTRTCDVSTVSKNILLQSSFQHISDVQRGIGFFNLMLDKAATLHDHTKIEKIDQFYADFKTGFKIQKWYAMHKKNERHHINSDDGIRDDVNVIDLIEHIVDCVMAGRARSGSVFPIELPNELLQKIVKNSVDMLNAQIIVD